MNPQDKISTTIIPQATPLFAAFTHPTWSDEAGVGLVIGWRSDTFNIDGETWDFSTPLVVPLGTGVIVTEEPDFFEYDGAAVEVYLTMDEATAAVPRLSANLREDLRQYQGTATNQQDAAADSVFEDLLSSETDANTKAEPAPGCVVKH